MSEKKEIVMNGAGVAELGFPGWPQFDPKSKAEIAEALDTGAVCYWTGHKGMEFEDKFAKWCGAKMAISCTNGTAALHIGIATLGIGPGDEVIVPVLLVHRVLVRGGAGGRGAHLLRRG